MRVLGIDASTKKLAWAIVEDGKLVEYGEVFFKEIHHNSKLHASRKQLEDFIPLLGHIDYIGFEQAIKVTSVSTMIQLAEMFGVAKSVLLGLGCKLVEFTPQAWGSAIGNPAIAGEKKRAILQAHPELKTRNQQSKFIREYRKNVTLDYVEKRTGIRMPNDDLGDATAISFVCYDKLSAMSSLEN